MGPGRQSSRPGILSVVSVQRASHSGDPHRTWRSAFPNNREHAGSWLLRACSRWRWRARDRVPNYNSHDAARRTRRSGRGRHRPSQPSGNCSSPQRGAACALGRLGVPSGKRGAPATRECGLPSSSRCLSRCRFTIIFAIITTATQFSEHLLCARPCAAVSKNRSKNRRGSRLGWYTVQAGRQTCAQTLTCGGFKGVEHEAVIPGATGKVMVTIF